MALQQVLSGFRASFSKSDTTKNTVFFEQLTMIRPFSIFVVDFDQPKKYYNTRKLL
jgi:hypothetical protein